MATFFVALALAAAPASMRAAAGPGRQQAAARSARAAPPLTILQINDVYSTVPIGGAGGLARVATLKQQMAADGRTPWLVLAGDFLSSSVASTVFKGEQMIAALNAAGLDMATLGNHEFDFGFDILQERMAEARWQWVVSNVVDAQTGRPIGGAAPFLVRTFGTLKVGFIGLCLTNDSISPDKLERIRLIDPSEAAAMYLPILKAQQVDVIVALTHLTMAEDRVLAERFPEIDLIVGGHEHEPIAAIEGRTFISKAGSDAKFVARIDITRRSTGTVERVYELLPVTAALADDPRTAAVVNDYEARLGTELQAIVGTTRVPLHGESASLRSSETNLGNLTADALRAAAGAEVAIVNSGGIRGDRVHPAGPLTRQTLVEIHPFGNTVCKIAVTGRALLEALNHGVGRLPDTAGQFPQVSGLRFRVNPRAPPGERVQDVTIDGRPLEAARAYSLALPDFLLRGGDGYSMFADRQVLVGPESGPLMVSALEQYVAARGEIAPAVEGRIVISETAR